MKGWKERVLKVDLGSEEAWVERIPRDVLLNLLGGKGLGAYLLYKESPKGVDPLFPENPLIFAVGPVSGLLPACGRYVVVTKSPLTGYFIDSHASGSLGAEIKFAGYDAILIKDIPLLIETGHHRKVDRVVVVSASRENQLLRLLDRGLSREEAERRIASQLPIEEKVKYADFVIQNDGSLEEARRQVEAIFRHLKELSSRH